MAKINISLIKKYKDEVTLLIRSLGFKSAFISDESIVSDFISYKSNKDEVKNILKKVGKKIKLKIKSKDLVWKIAQKINKKNLKNV